MLGRMTDHLPFVIKADREGFLLIVNGEIPLPDLLGALRTKLEESKAFFQNSRMILDLRRRTFDPDEIHAVRTLLEQAAGVELAEVRLGSSNGAFFRWAGAVLGVKVSLEGERERAVAAPQELPSGVEPPLVVRQTCRSGTRIESPAELVILGDVNPGAEIIATGDIVVFGTLRGVAHAGAEGDRSAKIWALHIEPQQLRIADVVALPPRGRKPKPKRYEVAEVKGDLIQVVSY